MQRLFQIICLIGFGAILMIGFPLQDYADDNLGIGGMSKDVRDQRIKDLKEIVHVGEIPLYFTPNQGQVDEQALFYCSNKDYTLWCTQTGLVFDSQFGKGLRVASTLDFKGAQRAEVVPLDVADYTVSYFKGRNQAQWNAGIQTSKAVLYKGLYANIDLKLYGKNNLFEYDWIVKKGGDPSRIQFTFDGVDNIRISEAGDLIVETAGGRIVHTKPYAYQDIEGERRAIDASFVKIGPSAEVSEATLIEGDSSLTQAEKNTYGFILGDYDPRFDLIIDPLLVFFYSSYLGGTDVDQAWDITVDHKGRAYITGFTASTDFPTTAGAYNTNHNGAMDVFVTKFDESGTDLIFSTFIGGSGNDWSYGIAVDAEEYVFITGGTASANFPINGGAYDNSFNGETDAFVAKLNKKGSSLMLSTFIGGSGEDIGYDLVLGPDGTIFITGSTDSDDYPTTKGADDRTLGLFFDGFVTKFDSEASILIYSTYVGDDYLEELFGIAVDEDGEAYVTGYVDYNGDPLEGNDSDVWAVKLNDKGSKQLYSFIFGGSDDESGRAVVVDEFNNAYIVGWTGSSDFPTTPQAFDPTYNGHTDAFVCKLKKNGSGFRYCSYLGGTCYDWGEDIDLYDDLSVVVTGYTTTGDFPVTEDAFDPSHNGAADAFVSYVSPDGRDLPYSTFLGGSDTDYGTGIAVDIFEVTHTTGYTLALDFPTTPDAFQRELALTPGGYQSDGYYVKFARHWPIAIEVTYPANGASVAGVVRIEAEVEADGEVAWVTFDINGETHHTDYEAPYQYDWDTAASQTRTFEEFDIKVTASDTDPEPHLVAASLSVLALNDTLDLQAERDVYRAWLSEKEYARLELTVLDSGTLETATKYEFIRQEVGDPDWYIVKTISSDELEGDTYTFLDNTIEAGKQYRYIVVATSVSAWGESIVGVTESKLI